jgi:hypothetical protein
MPHVGQVATHRRMLLNQCLKDMLYRVRVEAAQMI